MSSVQNLLFIGSLLIIGDSLSAQNPNREKVSYDAPDQGRKEIIIPDIPGYISLTGDFHMHTIFSDGNVWPVIRVEEAWSEGLDAIAITDHIEYRPHREYLTGDLNAAFDIAREIAVQRNLILIHGAEITRRMPPGHFNALFIKDAEALVDEDPLIQIEEANKQGAFVFWNHPGWASQQPDTTIWWDLHTEIYDKGWLHGIEVYNYDEWYPLALEWCTKKDLTVMVNSDIHNPAAMEYDLSKTFNHRPLTIIFAKERTEEGIKEALFKGRTLGWFGSTLVGKEELIKSLCIASLTVKPSRIITGKDGSPEYQYELRNPTHLSFILKPEGNELERSVINLYPETITYISSPDSADYLNFQLLNCYSDLDSHPVVSLRVDK